MISNIRNGGNMKRLITVIACVLFLTAIFGTDYVHAADIEESGVEISYWMDKEEYQDGEEIKAYVSIHNKNKFGIHNVSLLISSPEEYAVKNAEKLPIQVKIAGNSKEKYQIVLAKKSNVLAGQLNGRKADSIPLKWIVGIGCILVAAIIIFVILVCKKKRKKTIASALIFVLLAGLFTPIIKSNAQEASRKSHYVTMPVTINGTEQRVGIDIYFDYDEQADWLTIDTSGFGYSEERNAYVVTEKISGIKGELTEPKKYTELILHIYDSRDNLICEKTTEPEKEWCFEGTGLYPGMNKIEVKAVGSEDIVSSIYLFDILGVNYDALNGAEVDTDLDGLYDLLENNVGTDIHLADTDGDGLTDYQEVCELGTDPLSADSDNNGANDAYEDEDGDGITNIEEYKSGTSPYFEDSDFDGISDSEEISTYGTNPLLEDTDGDGASDFWEITNKYDPQSYNESFVVKQEGDKVNEALPVSPSVEVTVKDGSADVESLQISKVYNYDNPYISRSVTGYLGDAFEFTMDGSFEKARISFAYDTSLGTIGDDFQPRIYYFNEEKKMFEELENQTVKNGVVSADTTHFSIYALLDKIGVDEAWNKVKRSVQILKEYGSANITFCVDSSASMAWADPANLRGEVMEYFIDHLTGETDKVSIETYTKKSTVIADFTSDKEVLKGALAGIGVDTGLNADSGTDGAAALSEAIDRNYDAGGTYRYIVFFSDGKDTDCTYSYEQIADKALEKKVVIYTVGIGIENSDTLNEIAEKTRGQSFYLTADSSIENIFSDIANEMIARSSDTNGDGISDYYTEMIYKGEILLSNGSRELVGCDFNYLDGKLSDDHDGDGLKNGDEIRVVADGDRIYIKMKSHPLMENSDGDGIDDYTEHVNGTNPMLWTVNKACSDYVMTGSNFNSHNFCEAYDSGFLLKGLTGANALIYGVWNKDELYRDLMIDYYSTYVTEEMVKNEQEVEKKRLLIEYFDNIIAGLNDSFVFDAVDEIQSRYPQIRAAYNFKSALNGMNNADEIARAFADDIGKFILKVNAISEDATQMRFECNGMKYTQKLLDAESVQKVVDVPADFLNKYIYYIQGGVDVIDTIGSLASINANSALLQQNLDQLDYLINYSEDDHARDAAKIIKDKLMGCYASTVCAIVADCLETAGNVLIAVATKIPYILALVIARDAVDLVFGIKTDIEQHYEMLCYHEMMKACVAIINTTIQDSGEISYEIGKEDALVFRRNMIHLMQLRILGEKKYFDWNAYDGIFANDWIRFDKPLRDSVNSIIALIEKAADKMGYELSDKLEKIPWVTEA